MADLKITSLPPLAEGSIQATDVLALADLSATETKKVTVKDLVAAAVVLLDANDIPAAKIATPFAANSVVTATIQDDAVTSAKLATDSVTADAVAANAIGASELADNAVDSGALAANSVITSKITDLNVTADKLASNAVTTVKILDANVTYAKLNLTDGDIPGAKITGNSITNAQIGANAVGSSELADDAVDTDAIADSAVTNAKLANSSVSLGGISISLGATDATPAFNLSDATNYPAASLSGTVSNAQLAGSITGDKLADSTIGAGKLNLADGSISGAKITGDSITAAQIGANAVGASELANDAVDTAAIADDAVTNDKLANTSINLGGVSIALGATDTTPAFNLTDATNYPASSLSGTITNAQLAGSITGDKLTNATVTYAKLNISDGDIAGAKIAGNSITAAQIAANAVTASELADDAVDTDAVADAAITSAKIAANTITAGNLAANSVGASELADNAVDTAAVANGAITRDKIADGAINAAKLDGTISATSIGDNTVTSAKIAANAVGAAELADNAVDTAAVANAAITNDKVASGISGTKIGDGTITAAKLNTSNIDRSLNVASGNLGINNSITAGTRSGITYNAQGLITATTALVSGDLPIATSSAVGGVSVGTGLSVNGAGALSITNSITAASISGITYNAQGQITSTTALVAADLPVATTSAKGAVQITSGGGLTVDGSGNLITATSGVSAGTYQSVTVNNKGVVTAGASLTEGQIPSLPASKITTGTLDAARIGADTIDSSKLSNSSTTIIQSIAQLGYPTAAFTGQLLFDPIAEDAFLWDGNAWNPITTLTKGALVRLGTYDASQSEVSHVTSAGSAAGLTVGANLPAASSAVDGGYVVVSVQGTPSGVAGITSILKPPDYLLGVTNSSGSNWVEIDLSETVASQTANQIGYTPYGQLQSTNVQAAIDELETEKVAKAGSTITGELLIGNTGSLVFEGATADAFETRLTVQDPTTSDKVITLPNVTGTVITTGDTGTVTGTMLANDTIQNVDIKSDAEIAFTKLADLTSAQILVGNASNKVAAVAVTGDISINNAGLTAIATGVIVNSDISNSAAITGSKVTTGTTSAVGVLQLTDSTSSTSATTAATPNAVKSAFDLATTANTTAGNALAKAGGTMTGNLIIDNAKELRLSEADSDGAHYSGFKAQAQSADITYTLPATAPTTGQVLKAGSTATTLEWAADSATDATKLPLAGGTMSGALNMGSQNITNGGTITGTFVGDITGDVTGNADTATTLETARTIGGVSFNGSANINLPGVNASGTQDTSGNAATATKFASSVNIGGVAFDGSASINLPGVNATGNQDTTGNAASFTVTANNSTDETVYLLFADGATGSQGAESDTGLTYNPSTGLLTSTGFSGAGTSLTALNASNLSSGTVATARLGTGTASNSNFLRGDSTWQTIDLTALSASNLTSGTVPDARFPATLPAVSGANLTALNASNLSSGTVNVARLGSGSSVSSKFLRGDNTWQTISATPEGTAILSTGESGGTKFLREDGDGTCSWQPVVTSAAGSNTQVQFNNSGSFAGSSSLTFNSGTGALTATSFVGNVTGNLTGTIQTAAQANITSLGTLTGLTVDGDLQLEGDSNKDLLWDKSDGRLEAANGTIVSFGNTNDLQIYHQGNGVGNAYITNTAGWLVAQGNQVSINTAANNYMGRFEAASVGLYSGGTERLQANSTGVAVTGHLTLGDQEYAKFGVGADLTVGHNNSTNINFVESNLSPLVLTTASDNPVKLEHSGSVKLATSSTGVAVTGGLTVSGDLTVSGTTTTVNSTTVEVADKNIELGKVSSPSDTTADGGGLTLKGSSDKTFNWVNSTDAWTSSEHIQVASGKTFIGDGSTLTALNASNLATGTIDPNRTPSGIKITNTNSDATYFPVLISGAASNNSTVYTDGGQQLSYNTSTNVLTAGTFSGSGASLTSLNASNLGSGTVPTARLGSGTASSSNFLRGDNSWQTIDLTNLSASNLTSGTVPDARFPSTLPAISGANLTNVNATTLDSIDSGSFLRSDANDTMSGELTFTSSGSYPIDINGSSNAKIVLRGSQTPYIQFRESNTDKAYIQWDSNGFLLLRNQEDSAELRIKDDITFSLDAGSTNYKVWHAGNDGAGSGLDADMVDGVQLSGLLRSDTADTATGDITFSGGAGAASVAAGSDIRFGHGSWTGEATKIQGHSNWLYLQGGTNGIYFRSNAGSNRWRIDSSGHFEPDNDNAYNIGDTSNRAANVYAVNFHGDGSNLTNLPAAVPSYAGLLKYF